MAVQIGYTDKGVGVDIHIIKSTTVTLKEGNIGNLTLNDFKEIAKAILGAFK